MPSIALLLFILIFNSTQNADRVAAFNRAIELQKQGSLTEAVRVYQTLIANEPNYMEAHANLGVVLAQLGRYDEAIVAYTAALKLAPDLPPLLLNLGIAHYRGGRFEEAVPVLESMLARAPEHVQARQLLGLSLVELGHSDAAIAQLERTISANPDDPAVLYALGLSYLRQRYAGLGEIINRLAQAPNGLAASHLLKGQSHLGRFEYDQALKELERAAKLNSELPRLQYSLGLVYYSIHRKKDAVEAFERELRRRPRDFSTLYYLAYLHDGEDQTELARQRLDAALQLEPDSAEANLLLGKILMKQEKTVEAIAPLEKAVAGDAQDPLKHWQLARAYRQAGRQQDADRAFAEVKRLNAAQLKSDRARTPKP